jgi:lipoyl(octanoyl) transferase
MDIIAARWLGLADYQEVHALQAELVEQRLVGDVGNTLLLLEHPPVLTLGRGADRTNVLLPDDELSERGIQMLHTARGGDVTAHAPGQLVAYPIFDLRPDRCDVRRYVADLGEVMRGIAADAGVDVVFSKEYIGVWADVNSPSAFGSWGPQVRKVGAIGVKLSRWITMHGFAINVTTDMRVFDTIIPCGIDGYGATSLAALGAKVTLADCLPSACRHFERVFGAKVTLDGG